MNSNIYTMKYYTTTIFKKQVLFVLLSSDNKILY
jgi:hypothetical protein